MADLHSIRDGLVVTAFWQVNPGEVEEVGGYAFGEGRGISG